MGGAEGGPGQLVWVSYFHIQHVFMHCGTHVALLAVVYPMLDHYDYGTEHCQRRAVPMSELETRRDANF